MRRVREQSSSWPLRRQLFLSRVTTWSTPELSLIGCLKVRSNLLPQSHMHELCCSDANGASTMRRTILSLAVVGSWAAISGAAAAQALIADPISELARSLSTVPKEQAVPSHVGALPEARQKSGSTRRSLRHTRLQGSRVMRARAEVTVIDQDNLIITLTRPRSRSIKPAAMR